MLGRSRDRRHLGSRSGGARWSWRPVRRHEPVLARDERPRQITRAQGKDGRGEDGGDGERGIDRRRRARVRPRAVDANHHVRVLIRDVAVGHRRIERKRERVIDRYHDGRVSERRRLLAGRQSPLGDLPDDAVAFVSVDNIEIPIRCQLEIPQLVALVGGLGQIQDIGILQSPGPVRPLAVRDDPLDRMEYMFGQLVPTVKRDVWATVPPVRDDPKNSMDVRRGQLHQNIPRSTR